VSGRARQLISLLVAVGAILGLVGAAAPWIPHRAAGLALGGFYLFESTKLFPAVASGAVPLLREAFLLPLLTSALVLAMVPAVAERPIAAVRWLCPSVAAAVALAALPMYPAILSAHRNPEFRGQLVLAAGTFLIALLSPLARRLPTWLVLACSAGLTAAGLSLPTAQFLRVRPLFAELYGESIAMGWGLIVCLLGLGMVLILALAGMCLAWREKSAS